MGGRLGEPVRIVTESCVKKRALSTVGSPGTRETEINPEGGDDQGEDAENIVVVLQVPRVEEKRGEDDLIDGGAGPRLSCGIICALIIFGLGLVNIIDLFPCRSAGA